MKGCRNPSPPFTTLHSLGTQRNNAVALSFSTSKTSILFPVISDVSEKISIIKDFKLNNRFAPENQPSEGWWRVVKGGEGLEQPFTPIFSWPSATYTVKVKGEGFLEIFFGVHRLLIKKAVQNYKISATYPNFSPCFFIQKSGQAANDSLFEQQRYEYSGS